MPFPNTLFPKKLFVTGTDTEIGKTLIAAMLVLGLRGKYWKPIQSGLESPSDTDWIKSATLLGEEHFFPETYRLKQALSPHISARHDGVRIELDKFQLPDSDSHLIVEGAGGVMVPLNEEKFMIDLIQQLALPTIIVAKSGLGTINHTLLTLDRLRAYDIPVFGVVLNGRLNPQNKQAIEQYGQTKVIAEIEPMESIDPDSLLKSFHTRFFPGKSAKAK